MLVSLILRTRGLPIVLGMMLASHWPVMADDLVNRDSVGATSGMKSIATASADLAYSDYYGDYYGAETNGDLEHAQELAAEAFAEPCGSFTPAYSGRGLSYAPGHPRKPHRDLPGDINRGDNPPYRYTISDCQRAGNPHCVASWAKPSITPKYSAWFVGGGAAWGGRGRCSSEGTWGMDYHGLFPYRRVWMQWTCGREQGGEGAYKTDGHTGPLAKH